MSLIDNRGRLFGRLNIVDASVLALIVVLVPLGYATYLLFRPAKPQIHGVSPSEITGAERRVGNGSALTAKFKIQGSGFTPLLRARIGNQDALGLVFESPNSADVLVGPVPPGKHDLILVDGVQEVARANGAIDIQASTGLPMRVSGWLIDMERPASAALAAGKTIPDNAPSSFEVAAIGPERPGRSRMRFGGRVSDGTPNGLVEREAVLILKCDSPPLYDTCSVGGQPLTGDSPLVIALPGAYRFELQEVLPMTPPTMVSATVRIEGPGAALVQPGDQDAILDSRRARVTAVTGRGGDGTIVTLSLGVDQSREGWRYRGQVIRPGGTLSFTTDRYESTARVLALTTKGAAQ